MPTRCLFFLWLMALSSVYAQQEPSGSAVKADGAVSELRQLFGNIETEDGFLKPDEAFKLDVFAQDGQRLGARFDIAEGYYLYRDKIDFSASDQVRLLDYALPDGKEKEDEYFGTMVVYYNDIDLEIPFERTASTAESVAITAKYQGCAEKGICYPPMTKRFAILLPVADANATEATTSVGSSMAAEPGADEGRSYLSYILGAFVIGLLLTFTPCVLPMIPILSSVLVDQGEKLTKVKAGGLSIAYVLGTAVTYTTIGVIAGATGDQLQAYFQNIWAIGAISVLFLLMALSMFGLFHIHMPAAVQSRLHMHSEGCRKETLIGVFLLGLISALVVGACVSPLLISALGVAIAKADPLLGGLIMFSLAMGMGVILVAMGLGAGFLLPKAGVWMERVRHVFGVLLLAVAIYLLGTIPAVPVLLLWGVLLVVCAVYVYLGATRALPEMASGWRYLWMGIGTILLIWGVLALLGGIQGNRDILKPVSLQTFTAGELRSGAANNPSGHELFQPITTIHELDQMLTQAKAAQRPVLLDYYADWCVECVRMARTTFSDTRVIDKLQKRFMLLQVDVTDPNDPDSRALKKRYGVLGPPALLYFDANGQELEERREYGYLKADAFLKSLEGI